MLSTLIRLSPREPMEPAAMDTNQVGHITATIKTDPCLPETISQKAISMKDKIKKPGLIGNKNAVGNSGGRPRKLKPDEETLKTLTNLGKIQCTTKESASFLEVSEPTFIEFLKRFKEAEEAFDRGKDNGKSSLRRAQFKSAIDGNATMLIWMGKQLLGQRDKLDHEVSGKDGDPIQVVSTMSPKAAAEAYAAILKGDD